MKYWEELHNKWGFSDGDAIPPDARACREVYIREINKLAKRKGSSVRLLAYDRPGMHNCYLILRVDAESVRNIPPRRLYSGDQITCKTLMLGGWSEPPADDAMQAAIEEASEMDLDSLVISEIRILPIRRSRARAA
jgi:hypothetical protein